VIRGAIAAIHGSNSERSSLRNDIERAIPAHDNHDLLRQTLRKYTVNVWITHRKQKVCLLHQVNYEVPLHLSGYALHFFFTLWS